MKNILGRSQQLQPEGTYFQREAIFFLHNVVAKSIPKKIFPLKIFHMTKRSRNKELFFRGPTTKKFSQILLDIFFTKYCNKTAKNLRLCQPTTSIGNKKTFFLYIFPMHKSNDRKFYPTVSSKDSQCCGDFFFIFSACSEGFFLTNFMQQIAQRKVGIFSIF